MAGHTHNDTDLTLESSTWQLSPVYALHVSINVFAAFLPNKASVGGVLRLNGFVFLCWGRKLPVSNFVTYSEVYAILEVRMKLYVLNLQVLAVIKNDSLQNVQNYVNSKFDQSWGL